MVVSACLYVQKQRRYGATKYLELVIAALDLDQMHLRLAQGRICLVHMGHQLCECASIKNSAQFGCSTVAQTIATDVRGKEIKRCLSKTCWRRRASGS